MKKAFFVSLLTLFLGVLETTFFSWPLLFLWVICFSIKSGEKESFWLAFLSGLFADFLKGEDLGKTALFFLGFSLLVFLYKRKFKVDHPLYFFPFIGLAVMGWKVWEIGKIGGIGEIRGIRVFWSLLWAVGFLKIASIFTPKKEKIKL